VIVPLFGTATFSGETDSGETGSSDEHPIWIGHALFIGEGQKHRVRASEDSAFLVIIGLRS
jgi:hypothetical protein